MVIMQSGEVFLDKYEKNGEIVRYNEKKKGIEKIQSL
jgi:hypothetical protein